MKITIQTQPAHLMRYDTLGDYFFTADGDLYIFVTDLADKRHAQLIALHELVEALVTQHRGILEPDILAFDKAHLHLADPGMDPAAPYHKEHVLATGMEMILASELDVDWTAYEEACTQAMAISK